MVRDAVAGPNTGPEHPFPIRLSGKIIKGFGRGSKELGIPTANIPITGLDVGGHTDLESGIFYGFAGLSLASSSSNSSSAVEPPKPSNQLDLHQISVNDVGSGAGGLPEDLKDSCASSEPQNTDLGHETKVYPMVMSIGWNPFYKNEVRSVEVHIIHKFKEDFYNALMNLSILGFIRHEQDYDSLESLVVDIKTDIDVTERSVARSAYAALANDPYLINFKWANSTTA